MRRSRRKGRSGRRGTRRTIRNLPLFFAMTEEMKVPALPEGVKKPANAYFIFSNEKREAIMKEKGCSGSAREVAKFVKEKWDGLKEKEKKVYQDEAEAQKKAWQEFLETEDGKAYMKASKEEEAGFCLLHLYEREPPGAHGERREDDRRREGDEEALG